MKSICILGRQPKLGLAELESLYGPKHIQALPGAALLDIEAGDINFTKLGGTIKVARILAVLPGNSWRDIEKYLSDKVPENLSQAPAGKFTLGLSVYGYDVKPQEINASLLKLKTAVKGSGRPVRVVPNKTPALSSAQVLHNKLTSRGGWELLVVADGRQTILAQTMFVQDIEGYASRDQARPKRDARVGMLPPKLAQIIVNLAAGQIGYSPLANRISPNAKHQKPYTILDPFCGTGVIMQEAVLMGYKAVGTDIDARMVEYSETNLDWLISELRIEDSEFSVSQADATNYKWDYEIDAVASETYLGRPLAKLPAPTELDKIVNDVNTIIKKFLKNIHPQLKSSTPLCLAVPAWQTAPGRFKSLPALDKLTDMGYSMAKLKYTSSNELIYYRPNQIVARKLIVLERS